MLDGDDAGHDEALWIIRRLIGGRWLGYQSGAINCCSPYRRVSARRFLFVLFRRQFALISPLATFAARQPGTPHGGD